MIFYRLPCRFGFGFEHFTCCYCQRLKCLNCSIHTIKYSPLLSLANDKKVSLRYHYRKERGLTLVLFFLWGSERRRATNTINAFKVGLCRGIIRFDGQYFQEKIPGALHVFPVKTHFSEEIISGNEISTVFDLPL